MNINPKIVMLIALLLIVAGITYWVAEERFEAVPPAGDTAEVR